MTATGSLQATAAPDRVDCLIRLVLSNTGQPAFGGGPEWRAARRAEDDRGLIACT